MYPLRDPEQGLLDCLLCKGGVRLHLQGNGFQTVL